MSAEDNACGQMPVHKLVHTLNVHTHVDVNVYCFPQYESLLFVQLQMPENKDWHCLLAEIVLDVHYPCLSKMH